MWTCGFSPFPLYNHYENNAVHSTFVGNTVFACNTKPKFVQERTVPSSSSDQISPMTFSTMKVRLCRFRRTCSFPSDWQKKKKLLSIKKHEEIKSETAGNKCKQADRSVCITSLQMYKKYCTGTRNVRMSFLERRKNGLQPAWSSLILLCIFICLLIYANYIIQIMQTNHI